MIKILVAAAIVIFLAIPAFAQDVPVNRAVATKGGGKQVPLTQAEKDAIQVEWAANEAKVAFEKSPAGVAARKEAEINAFMERPEIQSLLEAIGEKQQELGRAIGKPDLPAVRNRAIEIYKLKP